MTTMEPFLPHPDDHEQIAAADPGQGAPAPAPGFGVPGEEPDQVSAEPAAEREHLQGDTPFRTPTPPQE